LNLTATYYSVARWLFLRDTGRKLLHIDRQLATDDAVLDDLRSYLAEALERKRMLGQYAVVWRDGRVLCIGPDAPAAPGVPSTVNPKPGDTCDRSRCPG
jgi:hypothetical protein